MFFCAVSIVVLSQLLAAEAIRSRCYNEMRSNMNCFDLWPPFTNTNFHLPQSPGSQNIQFKLFTTQNRGTAQMLVDQSTSSVTNSNFDNNKDTKIVVHGFASSSLTEWIPDMVTELLQKDVNVIVVDWADGAKGPNYFQAAANTRVVGAQIASLIITAEATGASRSKFHIIGHSLGSHIAGYAGHYLGGSLGRITGLDPAAPLFENYDEKVRLNKNDAAFVDIIHTDAEPLHEAGLGTVKSIGHADFFPNKGHDMPGCPPSKISIVSLLAGQISDLSSSVSCSHGMAPRYFTASINDNNFQSFPCSSSEGSCHSCGSGCSYMGYNASPSRTGLFVTSTQASYPY